MRRPVRKLLAHAIEDKCRDSVTRLAVFCNEVKGKSALALSRDLGLSYKSSFVLLHKLREALAEEMKGRVVGGKGKVAEGWWPFWWLCKPANQKEYRRDRRYARNQNGKRRVVVIARERGGNSVPAVFGTESQAASFIRARIAKGTVVHADEAGSWGMACMIASKCGGLILRKHISWTALAPMWRKNISAACECEVRHH